MVAPETGQPFEEMRRVYRDLESTWDTLTQAGVEIQDHTGCTYDPGEKLKVIAFQPMPECIFERVIETIKPTVYLQGRWIQMGEIIVGVPEQTTADASPACSDVRADEGDSCSANSSAEPIDRVEIGPKPVPEPPIDSESASRYEPDPITPTPSGEPIHERTHDC